MPIAFQNQKESFKLENNLVLLKQIHSPLASVLSHNYEINVNHSRPSAVSNYSNCI